MKPTDTKIVNVYAAKNGGSFLTKAPFSGNIRKTKLTVEQIKQCLYAKMKVEEIVGNQIIPLDFTNYNKDNSGKEETAEAVKPVEQTKPMGTVISLDKNGNIIKTPVTNTASAAKITKTENTVKNTKKEYYSKK